MELDTLKDLYIEQLRDLYDAEVRLSETWPKLAQQANNPKLKEVLRAHAETTKTQAERLETIFDRLGEKKTGETCEAMQGLIKEVENLLQKNADPAVLDAGIIASAQRIEHYEMAGFGTARTYARRIGAEEDVNALQGSLNEAASADQKFTELAEQTINPRAEA